MGHTSHRMTIQERELNVHPSNKTSCLSKTFNGEVLPNHKRLCHSITKQLMRNKDETDERLGIGHGEILQNHQGRKIRNNHMHRQQGNQEKIQETLIDLLWPKAFSPNAAFCRFFNRRTEAVESLAFTPDGLWLAVGRTLGQIDIYDVAGQILHMSLPGGESRSVRSLIFIAKIQRHKNVDLEPVVSLFNYRLISTGLHGMITEWNLQTQTAIRTIPSFGGAIFSADVSESLGLLAIASDDGSARLFKLRSGAMIEKRRKERDVVAVENHDNEESGDGESQNEEEEEEMLTYWKSMTRHQGRLLSVCFYGDRWLFGGTTNSTVLRWKLSSGISDSKMTVPRSPTKRLNLPEKRGSGVSPSILEETHIWSIVALPSYGILVSGDSRGNVIVWDVTTSTAIKVFSPHEKDVLSMCVTSASFFSVGVDGRLNIFTTSPNGEWIHSGSRYPHEGDIRAITVSSLGAIATGSADTAVKLVTQIQSLDPKLVQLPNVSAVLSSSWVLPCEPLRLVLTVLPNRLEVWCLMEEEESHESPEVSRELTFGSGMKSVKVASIELDDDGPWLGIRCAALSTDGTLIAVSNDFGTRLFKLDLTELSIETVIFKNLKQYVCSALEFTKLGSGPECLVTGVISRLNEGKNHLKLVVWDLENETVVTEFKDVDSAIQTIKVSDDGQWIAVRTCAGYVSMYSLDTSQLVQRIPSFPKLDSLNSDTSTPSLLMAGAMAFSPDSKYLCIIRLVPGAFMLYNTVTRSMVTGSQFKPQYNTYKKSSIFKIVNTNIQQGEVGDVEWCTSPSDTFQQRELPDDSALRDFIVNKTIPLHTLLYKTAKGVGSTRFQIMETTNDLESEDENVIPSLVAKHNKENRKKKRSYEEMVTEHESSRSEDTIEIAPKLNPCKSRNQAFAGEVFRVVVSGNRIKPNLLVFLQPKKLPPKQVSGLFHRKRFAEK